METVNAVIIAALAIQGISLLIAGWLRGGKGISLAGTPSIAKPLFYSGKIALFSSWGLMLFKAIFPGFYRFTVPPVVAWIAAGILCLGSVILIISVFALQGALRVGLPKEETSLVTKGLYKWSRNPLYLGVFLVCIASCIFFPNPVNILLALYAMVIHDQIVRGEEKFLEQRFGEAWRDYTRRVRRWF